MNAQSETGVPDFAGGVAQDGGNATPNNNCFGTAFGSPRHGPACVYQSHISHIPALYQCLTDGLPIRFRMDFARVYACRILEKTRDFLGQRSSFPRTNEMCASCRPVWAMT